MMNYQFFCGASVLALSIGIATGNINANYLPIISTLMITVFAPVEKKTEALPNQEEEATKKPK